MGRTRGVLKTINKLNVLMVALVLLAGCIPYPWRTVMPLKTRVVDAETGAPLRDAQLLRIVCDVHDPKCAHGRMDRGKTDEHGKIELNGARKWGLWTPAPGGMPVPDHLVVVWAPGYEVFVFSQYHGGISYLKSRTDREDLQKALAEIPTETLQRSPSDPPERLFSEGRIKLHRLAKRD